MQELHQLYDKQTSVVISSFDRVFYEVWTYKFKKK